MKFLKNPKWLLLVNSLPLLILAYLLYGQYDIIKSLLDEETIALWHKVAIYIGALGAINLIYVLVQTIRKQSVSLWFSILNLILHIGTLYLLLDTRLTPWSIPSWLVTTEPMFYIFTFLMPTIAYWSLLLLDFFTPQAKETNPILSIATTLMIPLSVYFFIQVIAPLWQGASWKYAHHFFSITAVLLAYFFLFFFARSIYILTLKRDFLGKTPKMLGLLILGIILPLIGLIVNQGWHHNTNEGIFGNFSSIWFFIIAFVNGLLLCLPNPNKKGLRLALYLARAVCLTYTLYFFIVFLPFLPLSIVAIFVFGAGFLMLTPLALFIVHIKILIDDFKFLKLYYKPFFLRFNLILAMSVLPLMITFKFVHDRGVLNQALDYVYQPNYEAEGNSIDKGSLKATLLSIEANRGHNSLFSNKQTPYISRYFNYLVLDNLSLSREKEERLVRIFFGKQKEELEETANSSINPEVSIQKYKVESSYNEDEKLWHSWVNLELKCDSISDRSWQLGKYSTSFKLPDNAFISNHYLYIEGKKEMGILAEKKTAEWVFRQIERRRRDPSLLYYKTADEIAFEIFPFSQNEVRKTGIELVHQEPFFLTLDSCKILLGTAGNLQTKSIKTEDFAYLTAEDKARLPIVERKPYLHFLLDCSVNAKGKREELSERLKYSLLKLGKWQETARFSFVGSKSKLSNKATWQKDYLAEELDGGYFVEQAIRRALYQNYQAHSTSYPIFILVTGDSNQAIIGKDFSDLAFTYPERSFFYELKNTDTLVRHSLESQSKLTRGYITLEYLYKTITVRELKLKDGKSLYLPNNAEASFGLTAENEPSLEEKPSSNSLMIAFKMKAMEQYYALHPNEFTNSAWYKLLKASFKSRIMTPQTSYIVVENEAQKAMLKKKQEDVMNGNRNLDLSETRQMSEPSWLLLALLFALTLYFRKRHKEA